MSSQRVPAATPLRGLFSECPESSCSATTVAVVRSAIDDAATLSAHTPKVATSTPNRWIPICPMCRRDVLVSHDRIPIPFLDNDGLTKAVADIDRRSRQFEFARFRFTRNAFDAALLNLQRDDRNNRRKLREESLVQLGRDLRLSNNAWDARLFSQCVCAWGRGNRVWSNLVRLSQENGTNLGRSLADWLSGADNVSVEQAIIQGTKISGLGVSFASKHLRMMNPDRFPVLDEVLTIGLGYASNPKGYALFTSNLQQFSKKYRLSLPIAAIEAAIFFLVRPMVRQGSGFLERR